MLAARALLAVLEDGLTLEAALDGVGLPADARERALLRELCHGALRWQPRLAAIIRRLAARPPVAAVQSLLLLGLYQLLYMRVPEHAAVAETVQAARVLGHPRQAGFVNAVLRRFQRERAALLAAVDADPAARHALPGWWLRQLQADWPLDWEAIAAAGNARAPMTLRVNLSRTTRAACLEALQAQGLVARPGRHGEAAVVLAAPCDTASLPGHADGLVSVQDEAAQLAAPLLDAQPGMRVLDACAAPGNKTAQLLERAGGALDLTALDVDAGRLETVRAQLRRLGLAARLQVGDAAAPAQWHDGRPYERILLDAPCTASGVLRRHPDIRLRRTAGALARAAEQQARLLAALWPLLAPGGRLLYATCSVFAAENRAIIAAFLAATPGARALPLPHSWGRDSGAGRQILPGEDGMDGFFYACLEKH